MQKSKIEWCDSTWNPATGCLHNCPYCYARRIANRFGKLDDTSNMMKYSKGVELTEPLYYQDNNDTMRINPYPYRFFPTFHRYRLDEPARKTKGQKIFVCSMADLFGDWVPDEWIEEVFKACEKAPQHKYLFLTKNPKRYATLADRGRLPERDNYWWGASMTKQNDYDAVWPVLFNLNKKYHTFFSIEPIHENIEMGLMPEWIIIGAETGNRKGKVKAESEWIENIMLRCVSEKLFMKDSLKDLMGDDFTQEWPEGLR